ncbi:hypothetical protein, partial [Sabulibacter ruber]|uniref:hypothetical protein n=1 Tax=Sabulibacter ruber TaxID=2811901 RepID=UPI001A96FB48
AVNTLRHLFVTLDPDVLEAAFRRHARQLDSAHAADGRRTVALDGKMLRGSFDHLHDRTTTHVLSAFASDAALILAHREVSATPEEIGGVQALMAELGVSRGVSHRTVIYPRL